MCYQTGHLQKLSTDVVVRPPARDRVAGLVVAGEGAPAASADYDTHPREVRTRQRDPSSRSATTSSHWPQT